MDSSRIVVIVAKPWFSKSPWDSYVKHFHTEAEFYEWWHSLPDDSFTKTHAQVTTWSAARVNLVAPWSPPRL